MLEVILENISVSATIALDWAPLPWSTCTVVPLRDKNGRVLAYAEGSSGFRMKTGLTLQLVQTPIELDIESPSKLVRFMTANGLIGRPAHRDLRAQTVMSVTTEEEALEADRYYNFVEPGANPNRADGVWLAKDRLAWYKSLQSAVAENDLGWKPRSESINDIALGAMFVTPYQIKQSFYCLTEAHRIVIALKKTDRPDELAEILGVQQDEVWTHIVYHIDKLNSLLTNIRPSIVINHPYGEERIPYPISEEYERNEPEGTFDEAYALYIYKEFLSDSNAKLCKECGKVFTKRKTKTPKTSPRNTAQFCSDRCKNRYTQRKKRRRTEEDRKRKESEARKSKTENQ